MNEDYIEYFKIIIAGKKIEVECQYRVVLSQCINYLAEFSEPDFIIRASEEEIIAGRMHIPEMTNHDPRIAIRYADEYTEPHILNRLIAEKMILYDTFLMHGAVVALEQKSYMFCAASGVGKSTRAKLWIEAYPDSYVVNGDKPLIKVTDNEVIACGTPWCGNEGWNTNTMVPLQAIFLLERADEGEQTTIEEISLGKAFPSLLRQTYWPKDPDLMRKTIQLLKAFEGKVRIFRYRSTPTIDSVRCAYEAACTR